MDKPIEVYEALLRSDPRFSSRTYLFVNEILAYAQERFGEQADQANPVPRAWRSDDEQTFGHVTGQDLCYAAVEYSVAQYGYLAKTVLAKLGIRKTGDIGDVVYHLLEHGLMQKTESDRREDFDDVFDLAHELDAAFKFDYHKTRRPSILSSRNDSPQRDA
ncbi:MAG: hypothetical protein Q4G03_06740 [Planctomycetia bacterium]|nr:hypothetical protein [Planctomycetia bacterium]